MSLLLKSQHANNKHNTAWKVCLYGIYALVGLYQKSHLFAALTRLISDTYQLVRKYHTDTLSMKYSIFAYAYILHFQ